MLTRFTGTLACPLEPGNVIVIAGKTIDGAKKLHIKLCPNARQSNSDVGLQVSVFFGDNTIARNSLIDNEWGDEEIELDNEVASRNNKLPIEPGNFFEICIFSTDTRFHVSIEGQSMFTFSHRIPVETIRELEISGHLQVVTQFDHRTIFPSPWPLIHAADPQNAFSNDIPILFTPGHVIVITANAYKNPQGRFLIYFTESNSLRQALHFNVRFDAQNVVRNSMKSNGEFEIEERDGGFPFIFDQQFSLAIAFTDTEFLFAVDGIYFTNFPYRSANILNCLNGFKVKAQMGLQIEITGVDHYKMLSSECEQFEKYSRYNYNEKCDILI